MIPPPVETDQNPYASPSIDETTAVETPGDASHRRTPGPLTFLVLLLSISLSGGAMAFGMGLFFEPGGELAAGLFFSVVGFGFALFHGAPACLLLVPLFYSVAKPLGAERPAFVTVGAAAGAISGFASLAALGGYFLYGMDLSLLGLALLAAVIGAGGGALGGWWAWRVARPPVAKPPQPLFSE